MADLPYKFWINADSGEIVPVSHHHALSVLQDPTKFGFPPGMKGTEWEHPAHRVKMGKWKESESDPTLYRLMFSRGWVRSDNSSEDVLNLETTFLPDAAQALTKLLQTGHWFTDVFLDFDHAEGVTPDSIHLEDSDEIEAFADRTALPRRYAKLVAMAKKTVRRHRDQDDDDLPIPSLGGLSGPPMRDLDAVGESLDRHIERARRRLIEARRPRRPTDVAERPSMALAEPPRPAPLAEPGRPAALPGRIADPTEAGQVAIPGNYAALAAAASGRPLAPGRAQPARPREPGTDLVARTNQVVPLETLPAVVGGPRLTLTWHKITSLPGYVVNQIRDAFQPFFRDVLGADLNEISVATNLPGAGTNSADLQRMWNFLVQRGRVDDQFDMEAFGIDPRQYHVENAHVVDFGGHKFFLMEEEHGHMGRFRYIYVAPGRGNFTGRKELTSEAFKQWTGASPAGTPSPSTGPKPLQISKEAAAFLEKIPTKHKMQIVRRVEAMLTGTNLPPSSEKMHITAQGNVPVYRLKSGEYRILFSLADKQITILKIGHRQDAYRHFNESDEDLP